MANKHASLDALFADIADAIREKTGDAGTIPAVEFPNLIRDRLEIVPIVVDVNITASNIKDSSVNGNDDKCTFSNMVIKLG